MKRCLLLLTFAHSIILSFSHWSWAQIQSGPMVGYSEMREVLLWVQTKQAAKVKFMYWEQGTATPKFSTDEATTDKKRPLWRGSWPTKCSPAKSTTMKYG